MNMQNISKDLGVKIHIIKRESTTPKPSHLVSTHHLGEALSLDLISSSWPFYWPGQTEHTYF